MGGTPIRSTDSPPRRVRLSHDERRAQILDVARRLFAERSYAEVSTAEIAEAAGIRRGLLHHYFGTKRELFLAVVAELLRRVSMPVEPDRSDEPIEAVVDRHVGGWLDGVERGASMWFATAGAEGFGSDPELEALVSDARDATVERIIEVLALDDASDALRVVLRTFSGLNEVATREWLQRGSLDRAAVQVLLSTALLAMVRDVAPAVDAVQRAGEGRTRP